MRLKRGYVLVSLVLLAGCSTVPNASVSKDGMFPPPSDVHMKYLGPAKVEGDDPINACRVYVFKVADYYQTALWCPNGKASVTSSAHQKSDDDTNAAIAAGAQ